MSTAAQAFAPGSTAGGAAGLSALAKLPSSLPALAGVPSLSLPGLQQSSSATGQSTAMFDNSGFVVNYGGSASAGGAPQWLLIAGLGLAGWWAWKRAKS